MVYKPQKMNVTHSESFLLGLFQRVCTLFSVTYFLIKFSMMSPQFILFLYESLQVRLYYCFITQLRQPIDG